MGNLFQQWTNDRYKSNVHRVINRSRQERFTIVFNYNGNPDYIIRCLESCRGNTNEEKYAPITVEDYIIQKYKEVYSRAGVYKKETFEPPAKSTVAA
jgi:isopenicillin N synthase-like dioxygenase